MVSHETGPRTWAMLREQRRKHGPVLHEREPEEPRFEDGSPIDDDPDPWEVEYERRLRDA